MEWTGEQMWSPISFLKVRLQLYSSLYVQYSFKCEALYVLYIWGCVVFTVQFSMGQCAVTMWSPIENPLDQAPPPPYEDKYLQLDFYQWGQSHRCYQGFGWVGEVVCGCVSATFQAANGLLFKGASKWPVWRTSRSGLVADKQVALLAR